MRARVGFLIDLISVTVSVLLALILRDNLTLSVDRLRETLPYLTASLLAAAVILPAMGLTRSIWRFTALSDYMRAFTAAVAIVLAALGLTFAFNRLDNVARALPVLQGVITAAMLVGTRALFRVHYLNRIYRKEPIAPLTSVSDLPQRNALIVGLSRLTETYLQSLRELAHNKVKVVGILGRSERHIGRLAASHRILGTPDQIKEVLATLEVHGVCVEMVIITVPASQLSQQARAALLEVERQGSIDVMFLTERLGFEPDPYGVDNAAAAEQAQPSIRFDVPPELLKKLSERRYWPTKRVIDVAASSLLLMLTLPLMLVLALAVGAIIGAPVTFWQQRPGLGGRPFRLYKFRTMAPAHDAHGRALSDEQRTSRFGNLLRRTRLDELPQLISILRGEMSFVGPRPLLPRDQSEGHKARLLVRPGLTGWAQVVGGRNIGADDKAALDLWYVQNASLALDFKIIVKTAQMIIAGERVDDPSVAIAWKDLDDAGVLRWTVEDSNLAHRRSAAVG